MPLDCLTFNHKSFISASENQVNGKILSNAIGYLGLLAGICGNTVQRLNLASAQITVMEENKLKFCRGNDAVVSYLRYDEVFPR